MSKELVDYREEYHEEALWTNSMFGGMPAYLISTRYKGNVMKPLHLLTTVFNFRPVCFIFLYLLGFYIALLLLDFKPWICFAGAIAYAFSSYFFVIIEAGHVSKVLALGYMPPIIMGVYAAFRGKVFTGSLVAGIFLGLQIVVNHLQITYYTLLIILILGVFELVKALRENKIIEFFKSIPYLLLFVILAVGANFGTLYTTYEYGKYSIRGRSELSSDSGNKTRGLDRDYATQWSYGIGETFTLLIPNFQGGASNVALKPSSATYNYLKNNYGINESTRSFLNNAPLYWGKQAFTQGPVYVGASVVFLFILGMFIVKGHIKWWLLTVTLLSVLLAWGRNFPALTNVMLDHFPGYSKFRTVSMTLIMAEFSMPLMALLAFKETLDGTLVKKEFIRYLKYAFFGLAALIMLIIASAGSFDFGAASDDQLSSQGLEGIVNALHEDRLALLRTDALRSLVFIALTAAVVWAAFLKKIKTNTAILLVSALFLVDMWPVNKRYLNSDNFVTAKEDRNPFTPSTADLVILNDKDPDFRVLNLTVSTFQDASTSYFHKSIGGYHGAKMKRYQELIDRHLTYEISQILNTFQVQPVAESLDSILQSVPVLNMLNTRYLIYSTEAPPLVNRYELGNAWFVESCRIVNNADEEINALSDFDPSREAIVDKRFTDLAGDLSFRADTTAQIRLTEYKPNYLKYEATAASDRIAVFSEIYYDKGWKAYVDGQPVPHFRANYVLRAMRLPSGNHVVEFRFHPSSYFLGNKVSMASSILLLLVIAGLGWREWKKNDRVSNM